MFGDTAVQRYLQLIPGDREGMRIGSSRNSSGILLSRCRVSEERGGFIDFLSPDMKGVVNPGAVQDQVRGYGVRGTPPQVLRDRTIEYEPTQELGLRERSDCAGDRTQDLAIKSRLLYQLSYAIANQRV